MRLKFSCMFNFVDRSPSKKIITLNLPTKIPCPLRYAHFCATVQHNLLFPFAKFAFGIRYFHPKITSQFRPAPLSLSLSNKHTFTHTKAFGAQLRPEIDFDRLVDLFDGTAFLSLALGFKRGGVHPRMQGAGDSGRD
jgi:hypothetical protein